MNFRFVAEETPENKPPMLELPPRLGAVQDRITMRIFIPPWEGKNAGKKSSELSDGDVSAKTEQAPSERSDSFDQAFARHEQERRATDVAKNGKSPLGGIRFEEGGSQPQTPGSKPEDIVALLMVASKWVGEKGILPSDTWYKDRGITKEATSREVGTFKRLIEGWKKQKFTQEAYTIQGDPERLQQFNNEIRRAEEQTVKQTRSESIDGSPIEEDRKGKERYRQSFQMDDMDGDGLYDHPSSSRRETREQKEIKIDLSRRSSSEETEKSTAETVVRVDLAHKVPTTLTDGDASITLPSGSFDPVTGAFMPGKNPSVELNASRETGKKLLIRPTDSLKMMGNNEIAVGNHTLVRFQNAPQIYGALQKESQLPKEQRRELLISRPGRTKSGYQMEDLSQKHEHGEIKTQKNRGFGWRG